MDFKVWYAAAQFGTSVMLIMLAVLQVARWRNADRYGHLVTINPHTMVLYASLLFVAGVKQLIWTVRGTIRAAGMIDHGLLDPSPVTIVLNIAMVGIGVAIFCVVARTRAEVRTIIACAMCLGVAAVLVGSYHG